MQRRSHDALFPYVNTSFKDFDTFLNISNTNLSGLNETGACTITFFPNEGAAFSQTTADIAFGGTFVLPVFSLLKKKFFGFATALCCFADATGVEFGGKDGTGTFSYSAEVLGP